MTNFKKYWWVYLLILLAIVAYLNRDKLSQGSTSRLMNPNGIILYDKNGNTFNSKGVSVFASVCGDPEGCPTPYPPGSQFSPPISPVQYYYCKSGKCEGDKNN